MTDLIAIAKTAYSEDAVKEALLQLYVRVVPEAVSTVPTVGERWSSRRGAVTESTNILPTILRLTGEDGSQTDYGACPPHRLHTWPGATKRGNACNCDSPSEMYKCKTK